MVRKGYVSNLLFVYAAATNSERISGRAWYNQAKLFVGRVAQTYGLEMRVVAAVVAALSPRNRWERNILDAENIIKAFIQGENYVDVKVATFYGNKDRAIAVLEQNDSTIVETSRKTESFLYNITQPELLDYITLDVWMCRALHGDLEMQAFTISEEQYETFQDAVKQAAELVGEHPVEFQAIVWQVLRDRIAKSKTSSAAFAQGYIQGSF